MDYRHKPPHRGPFWTPIGGPFCVPIDTLGISHRDKAVLSEPMASNFSDCHAVWPNCWRIA
jgi:hypothetical protein